MTTTTGGCGYISVSWSVINNVPDDAMGGISRFNVTLSSEGVSMIVIALMNSHSFTELPDDTLFNVTVIDISIDEKNVISLAFTSVRTIESMYV